MSEREYTRRRYLKYAGAGVVVVAAAGAGAYYYTRQAGPATQETNPTGPDYTNELTTADPWEKGGVINGNAWAGYETDEHNLPFENKYGCDVNVKLITSDPEQYNELRAGAWQTYDWIQADNPWMKRYIDEGWMREIPPEVYEPIYEKNLERLQWPFLQTMKGDGSDGKCYALVHKTGPDTWVGNMDRVDPSEIAWGGTMFGPENKDRYAIWDGMPDYIIHVIAMDCGIIPAAPDGFRMFNTDEIEKIKERAYVWFENAKFVAEDFTTVNNALLAEEIDYYPGALWALSPLRLEGHWNMKLVVPDNGPEGKGCIYWSESAGVTTRQNIHPAVDDWNLYTVADPDAMYVTTLEVGAPFAQINNAEYMAKFDEDSARALQLDETDDIFNKSWEWQMLQQMDTDFMPIVMEAKRRAGFA